MINTINPLGFVSTFTHDNVGNVLTVINPENEKTTFIYDAADRCREVYPPINFATTPTAMTVLYDYNGAGHQTRKQIVPMSESMVWENTYTKLGDPWQAFDPMSHMDEIGYDQLGRPDTITNAENETITTFYDNAGRVEAVYSPLGFATTFVYDPAGRRIKSINPLGKVTTTVYDDADRPIAVIDPEANCSTTTYDKANRVIAVANGENEITTTVYDDAGRIINVIDAIGGVTTTTYDDANRVLTVTNPAGETTTNVYDAAGRMTSKTQPGGGVYVMRHDDADRQIEIETPLHLITTTIFDDNGRPVAVIRPRPAGTPFELITITVYDLADRIVEVRNAENEITTNVWDAGSRLRNLIDPRGNTSTFSYDNANRRTVVVDAEGGTSTTVFDDDGRVTQTVDARGKSTFFQYDAAGQLELTADAEAAVTTFVYDNAGRRIEVIDAESRKTSTVYDRANRPIATVNPDGKRFTTVYDDLGRVQNTIDPLLHKTTMLYDGVGRVTATYDAIGNSTHIHYNTTGLKDRITDPNGHVTTLQYDADNRPTVTINAEGNQTENVYDVTGRVIAIVNEEGKRTTFTYDLVDRRKTVRNPLNQIQEFDYDAAGNLVLKESPRGDQIAFEYDKTNRLLSRSYSFDSSLTTFSYDATGNRTMMVDVISGIRYTQTYEYDDVNRMVLTIDPNAKDLQYSWNKVGQRKTMVDPDSGVFTYTYDTVGRLETISNPNGETTTLVYDIADRRIGQLLANGVVTSLSYDDANRLNEVESRNSSTVLLSSFNYLMDPAGNRTTLTASGSDGFLWKYDKTNQLLVEKRTLSSDSYTNTLTYDPRGNRQTLDGVDDFSYDYNDANRLETITDVSGITTYTYDDNGNQRTIEDPNGDITTNTWNGENRLILVEHPDSTETTYRYNGDGLRVFQDHDGTVTLFLYDGNNLLQETDDTGLVEAAFTYIPLPYAEVLSQRRDTESSFYLPDGIRNIRQLTDDAQVVTDEYAFDAFGNLRSATGGTANSQLYKGQLLSYRNDPHAGPDSQSSMHFRNQSATTFRFTSEDPAEDDLNLYRPVGNNPVNGEDPSGLADGWWSTLFGEPENKRVPSVIEQLQQLDAVRAEFEKAERGELPANHLSVDPEIRRAQLIERGVRNLSGIDETSADALLQRQQTVCGPSAMEEALTGTISSTVNFEIAGDIPVADDPTETQRDRAPEAILIVVMTPPIMDLTGSAVASGSMVAGGLRSLKSRTVSRRLIQPRLVKSPGQPGLVKAAGSLRSTFKLQRGILSWGSSGAKSAVSPFGMKRPSQLSTASAAGSAEGVSISGDVFRHGLPTRQLSKTPTLHAPPLPLENAFKDLASFRNELGPDPTRTKPDGGTVARLDISGQELYGISGHGQPVSINANNFNFGHAEIDALQQAANKGIKAKTAVIYVDRDLCKYCRRVDGLPAAMQDLGLNQLIVHDPVKSWRIVPGRTAVQLPRP